jgi:hypothetical protein
MTPEPILFLVSNGLLKHKDRMGAAIWEYLWLIDKVTKDEPDGQGKFNGVVLGGKPLSAAMIASDLKEHINTAKINLRSLQVSGYIVRHRLPDNRFSCTVTIARNGFGIGDLVQKTVRVLAQTIVRPSDKNLSYLGQKPVRAIRKTRQRHDKKKRKTSRLLRKPSFPPPPLRNGKPRRPYFPKASGFRGASRNGQRSTGTSGSRRGLSILSATVVRTRRCTQTMTRRS